MITFVTGGGRSGKSTFAETKANTYASKLYIATSIAFDDEMRYRIKEHQSLRDESWTTLEAYRDLEDSLHVKAKNKDVILLDCLTNMVSNLMIMDREVDWDSASDEVVASIEDEIRSEVQQVLSFAHSFNGDVIIVSNEVGMGLVPDNPLGRRFRDIVGRMNQLVAQEADEAYLIVSGLEMKLK